MPTRQITFHKDTAAGTGFHVALLSSAEWDGVLRETDSGRAKAFGRGRDRLGACPGRLPTRRLSDNQAGRAAAELKRAAWRKNNNYTLLDIHEVYTSM